MSAMRSKHNRQVAGNAHRPQSRLSAGTAQDGSGGRTQCWSGMQQMTGDALEHTGLARANAEMMELHLRLRPRQRGCSLERGSIAMLVNDIQHGLPRCGNHRPERNAHEWRRVRHARAGAERRPGRAPCRRCWTRAGHPSSRLARRTPWPRPRNRARSVSTSGFPTASPSTIGHMRRPDFPVGRRALPPRCQKGCLPGKILGGDEQLHEGRMGNIVSLRRQHEFGVGRHVDLAHPVA